MTFLNKKEDVLQIELTPYGRYLMSKGALKPAYYAFFDDDILYDSQAAGSTEEQTGIQSRILQNTPYLKVAACLQSPESQISVYEFSQEETYPHTILNLQYLTAPLGTSDPTSNFAPSWKSVFLKGNITGSVETVITGSQRTGVATIDGTAGADIGSQQYLKQIPQINATIDYKMSIKNTANDVPVRGRKVIPNIPASKVYSDGSYINLDPDQVLCQLLEKEGFYFKDGLEMQAFIYGVDNENSLTPLKFLPSTKMIKNGLLMEEPQSTPIPLDPSYVEYYIDLKTDAEISNEDLCQGIQLLKSQDILVELDIECPDDESIFFDIYGTRVKEIEDCE